MAKDEYKSTEKKILRLLYQTKAPMTIYEISKQTGISFVTVKKYVLGLVKNNLLVESDFLEEYLIGNRGADEQDLADKDFYEFNFGLLKKVKKKRRKLAEKKFREE